MQEGYLQLTGAIQATLNYIFSYPHLYRFGTTIIIFGICLAFKNLFTQYIFRFLLDISNKVKTNPTNDFCLTAFRNPVKNFILLLGAYFALKYYLPAAYDYILNKLFSSGTIILFAKALYQLIGIYMENEEEIYGLLNREIDKILIPFLSKILRFLVCALAFVSIASEWGYDVNGFVAGLGLGGLAFALAAKDMLANIFSGVVIIMDKPFNIGDWIKSGEVEGTVVDINFRSTKIRRFDQALVNVPNSNLVNGSIVNFTKRPMRQITFHLGITYDTPASKVKTCMEKIEQYLREHEGVDDATIFVKLDKLGDSALEVFLYFFTKTIVWAEYLTIKQDVNFKILEIVEEEGVSLAFPSTSVYMQMPAENKPKP